MKPGKVRSIALCTLSHQGRILVQRGYDLVKKQAFFRPLGGTIEFGELSQDTVIREIHEELGLEIHNVKFLGVLENIFTHNAAQGHEIVLIYDGEFADPELYRRNEFNGYEDGFEPIQAVWINLADYAPGMSSKQPPLYPTGLYELLQKSL